jgi:hypothetical protein
VLILFCFCHRQDFVGPYLPIGTGLARLLEWNFFARHRFFGLPAHGCVGPRSEELDPLRYDLRALPLAAAVLALKFPRLQPAFNINLSAFAEILGTGFSEFPENHNIVPFDSLLAIAIFPRKALIGRYRKTRDRLSAGGQIPKFGVLCPRWPMSDTRFNDIFFTSLFAPRPRL